MRRTQHHAGRDKEIPAELALICQQEGGLPLAMVRRLSPEELSELLRRSGNSRERSVLLAGLLALEAEFNQAAGDPVGYIRASLQAFCLLGEALEGMPATSAATAGSSLKSWPGLCAVWAMIPMCARS